MAWKTVFTYYSLCQGRTTDAAKLRDQKKRREKGVQENQIYPPEVTQIKLFFSLSHRISLPMSFSLSLVLLHLLLHLILSIPRLQARNISLRFMLLPLNDLNRQYSLVIPLFVLAFFSHLLSHSHTACIFCSSDRIFPFVHDFPPAEKSVEWSLQRLSSFSLIFIPFIPLFIILTFCCLVSFRPSYRLPPLYVPITSSTSFTSSSSSKENKSESCFTLSIVIVFIFLCKKHLVLLQVTLLLIQMRWTTIEAVSIFLTQL